MPESSIRLGEGQRDTSDDWDGINGTVINWMTDPEGAISVRPGIVPDSRLLTGDSTSVGRGVIGVYVWKGAFDGFFYAVHVLQDRTIWALSFQTGVLLALSTANPLTKLDGAESQVVFVEDGLRLMMVGGGAIQQWVGIGLSARLSAYLIGVNQPPIKSSHIVSVGNYIVSNDSSQSTANQIIWSDIGDGSHTTWDPLNFNTADADPDPVVAVGANLREVMAFGTKTMQVFGLTSDPSLPFASSIAVRTGTAAKYSVITRDLDFALLDDQRRFITSNGRDSEWIGRDVYKTVQDMDTVSDCFGFRLRIGFWDLLIWIFPTEKTGLVYDQNGKDWRQWRGWNGVDDFDAIRISSYATFADQNLHIVGDPLFANLWRLDTETPIDTGPGLPVVAEKITRLLDYDNSARKRCKRVRFKVLRGQSVQSSSGTLEPAMLDASVSNDGKAFTSSSRINLGIQGDYSSFRDWFPGGIYQRRAFKVRYSSGVKVSITRADEFWDPYGEEEA